LYPFLKALGEDSFPTSFRFRLLVKCSFVAVKMLKSLFSFWFSVRGQFLLREVALILSHTFHIDHYSNGWVTVTL
jgi:hypothetical protein